MWEPGGGETDSKFFSPTLRLEWSKAWPVDLEALWTVLHLKPCIRVCTIQYGCNRADPILSAFTVDATT